MQQNRVVLATRTTDIGMIVEIDFSLTVKTVTLILISGRGSAISSAKKGKSVSIYNLFVCLI